MIIQINISEVVHLDIGYLMLLTSFICSLFNDRFEYML